MKRQAIGERQFVGQRLGHYQILEEIGVGGMGEVYRARNEHLDREEAIKVLPEGTGNQAPQHLARSFPLPVSGHAHHFYECRCARRRREDVGWLREHPRPLISTQQPCGMENQPWPAMR